MFPWFGFGSVWVYFLIIFCFLRYLLSRFLPLFLNKRILCGSSVCDAFYKNMSSSTCTCCCLPRVQVVFLVRARTQFWHGSYGMKTEQHLAAAGDPPDYFCSKLLLHNNYKYVYSLHTCIYICIIINNIYFFSNMAAHRLSFGRKLRDLSHYQYICMCEVYILIVIYIYILHIHTHISFVFKFFRGDAGPSLILSSIYIYI